MCSSFFPMSSATMKEQGKHKEKMCKVNKLSREKKRGNIQQKEQFLKYCAKGGLPPEGNSMPIRGYTVYVYIIYIIYIHSCLYTYTYIWVFSCNWKGIILRSDKILGNLLKSALLVLIITVVVIAVAVITTFVPYYSILCHIVP